MRDPADFSAEPPSKSELKRRSRELQDLGDELVALPGTVLDALPLPEEVREAVEAGRRIASHGARLRQRLYIGKLLRQIDIEPVRDALARRGALDRQRVMHERTVERWRSRLLADEPAAWTELSALVAGDDLQELRKLAGRARAEQSASRPPAAARKLFRCLREALPGPDATMPR